MAPLTRKVLTGKVRPADPFELIQWLAHCQQDARKAVAELVQNSLDAGARRIDVVRRRDKGVLSLCITDDGHGVIPELPRPEALTFVATHIGHSRKRNLTPQQRRELMVQGQFGIGILGFWCLGTHLVMRTAVAGETPWELHLRAEEPSYEVRQSRGRLPFEAGTEVQVRGLRESVSHLVGARRLGEYLALELRGQILDRGAQIVIRDKVARGLAQKVFAVRPVQFPGRRLLLPETLAVAGQRPARIELYLLPEPDPRLRIGLAAGGTLVLDDLVELDSERLATTALCSGRFCGVVDFPDVEVSPGARRGVTTSPATRALADAVVTLLPALDQELAAEQRRSAEDVAQRQIKKLRRAFLAVRQKAPELELFAVQARAPAASGASPETAEEAAAAGRPVAASAPPGSEGGAAGPARPDVDGGMPGPHEPEEPAGLFPPGPLDHLDVRPPRTRVEILGSRVLRAVPCDVDGRAVAVALPIVWRVAAGPGRIEVEGEAGLRARFHAPDEEAESVIEASASDGRHAVTGQAVVRTAAGVAGAAGLAQGIPSPHFVEDAAGDWRSRVQAGRWEVNRAHGDYQEASQSERRQLRYLSALLAKEIVCGTYPAPQTPRILEQMVRLLTLVDTALE